VNLSVCNELNRTSIISNSSVLISFFKCSLGLFVLYSVLIIIIVSNVLYILIIVSPCISVIVYTWARIRVLGPVAYVRVSFWILSNKLYSPNLAGRQIAFPSNAY